MAKDGIFPFLTTWNWMQEQNQRGCFWYISCTTINFSDDLCTPLNPRTPCHHSPSFTLTFRLHPFPSISLKRNMPHFLPNLELPITTSINLHQPSRKLPAIFTSSWAAWSWIMIRCGPIKVAGSIDPLLRRFRCSLTEAPPMANSWSPTRSPCSSAHVPFFFFWGKDSQADFSANKKKTCSKNYSSFQADQPPMQQYRHTLSKERFGVATSWKHVNNWKTWLLSHLTILLPSRPHKGFHKNKRHPPRLDSQLLPLPNPQPGSTWRMAPVALKVNPTGCGPQRRSTATLTACSMNGCGCYHLCLHKVLLYPADMNFMMFII